MLKCNSEALILSSLQGRALLSRLHGLKSKGVQLKISSGIIDSTELAVLEQKKSQRFLPLSSHVSLSILLCSAPLTRHAFLAVLTPLLAVNVFPQVQKSTM